MNFTRHQQTILFPANYKKLHSQKDSIPHPWQSKTQSFQVHSTSQNWLYILAT